MKQTIKTTFFWLLTVVLLLFILFVDTTFYHVPSFIKMFRVEREIVIGICILLLLYHTNNLLRRRKLNLKQTLLLFCSVIGVLFIFSLLPQLFLKKYLVLWDENPFLAEYPLAWNSVSLFCSIIVVSGLLVILLLVKKLLEFRPNRYSNFEYRFLLSVIILSAIVFNIIEDRYTFARMSILQQDGNIILWIPGVLIVIITLVISFYKTWIDILNKREKYLGFFISLLIILVSAYLLFSSLLFPVYALSTTIKGFVLATLVFVNIYSIASFIGLLFRLPTASVYDRVTGEISSISRVSKMISDNIGISAVFQTIVEDACHLTDSDACWLAIENEDSDCATVTASINLSEHEKEILNRTESQCLKNILKKNKLPTIIYNIGEDERTLPLQVFDISWKSMIAVPLIQAERVVGVLYSVKKVSYAYDENDLTTLNTFAIQTNIAINSSPIIKDLKNVSASEHDLLKIKTHILDNLNILFPELPDASSDKISIDEGVWLFYHIIHSAIDQDNRTEIKGVLKTLFTLETDHDNAFQSAHQMIKKDYFGQNMTVIIYSVPARNVSLFCNEGFSAIVIGQEKRILCRQLSEKDRSESNHFSVNVQMGKNEKILTGTESIIEQLEQKSIFDNPGLSDINLLKKIIPEIQSDSGIPFLITLIE